MLAILFKIIIQQNSLLQIIKIYPHIEEAHVYRDSRIF